MSVPIRTSRFKELVSALIFIHRKPRLHIIGHRQNPTVHAIVPMILVVTRCSARSQCLVHASTYKSTAPMSVSLSHQHETSISLSSILQSPILNPQFPILDPKLLSHAALNRSDRRHRRRGDRRTTHDLRLQTTLQTLLWQYT